MTAPNSYIFQTVARLIFFLINVLAIYLLLRGHNDPGGGFIAGLATAISLILLSLAVGLRSLHVIIRVDPARIAFTGLAVALASSAGPALFGRPFLEHYNFHIKTLLLGDLHIGTPLLFDAGVYLVVVGITAKIIFVLAKSTQGFGALVRSEQRRYSAPLESPIEEQQAGEQLEPEEKVRKH